MNSYNAIDVDKYSKNLEALVLLVESVLNKMLNSINDSDLRQKEALLREVSQSIDRLSRLSIPIPDELRKLKLDFVEAIEVTSQRRQELTNLIAGLEIVISRIESSNSSNLSKRIHTKKRTINNTSIRIRNNASTNTSPNTSTDTSNRISNSTSNSISNRTSNNTSSSTVKSTLPITNQKEFKTEIIIALRILGGSGSAKEINTIIEQRMKAKFLPGDFEINLLWGVPIWRSNVHEARWELIKEGILRRDSSKDTWELSEGYK